ncbi:MAG TPA: Holliday junction resolvase RuvX [Candidatus Pacebacteria bacterium]|nr:Holliday junction resolvase RuvX [Candidatus Paceibacterota bacterium]
MMMKVLAIDYGTRRVGLAVSHGSLAQPLAVVENDEHLFDQLRSIINHEKIERVVIGLSENEMADLTREFAQELEGVVSVPIEFIDETLSSKAVEQKLKERGMKNISQQPIDHYAAALILEEWLAQQ